MQNSLYNNRVIHVPEDPILILDDEPVALELMKRLCNKLHIPAVGASNGLEGSMLLDKQKFSLYIVDLHMPGMDGEQFIQELKKRDPDAIFLIQSVSDSPDTIIKLMKLGAHDYVIKPVVKEIFWNTLVQSLEYYHLKNNARNIAEHTAEKLRNQLEWLSYKDRHRNYDLESKNRITLDHLRNSLYQGGGYGLLLSLLELLRLSARETGEGILVDRDLMNHVFENADSALRNLEGLDSLAALMKEEPRLESITSRQFMEQMPEMVKRVTPLMQEKGIEVQFPLWEGSQEIMLDMKILPMAVEELMINALKYAKPGSSVEIYTRIVDGYFSLGVKNDIGMKEGKGMPDEWEKLAAEPFTRFHPPQENIISVERFGLGLGLTAVNIIMSKLRGHFFISNINDHTQPGSEMSVLAQLLFPVRNGAEKASDPGLDRKQNLVTVL